MSKPVTTPEEGTFDKGSETDQLKKALRRICECGYNMADPRAGKRFSFRVDNKTFEHWREISA